MRIGELRRNDVGAAVAFVEAILDSGSDPTKDDAQRLRMLQDDVQPLHAALSKLYSTRAAAGRRVPSWYSEGGRGAADPRSG